MKQLPDSLTFEIIDQRFWARVDKTGECWEWQGAGHKRSNHGMFGWSKDGVKAVMYAHRYAYERLVGEIPEGLVIDHLCSNPRCVNPAHLEPVTIGENTIRARKAMVVCKRGHDLSFAYTDKRGFRTCRQCNNLRRREKRNGRSK